MNGTPSFSIIIPTHDRPVRLERCLASVAHQKGAPLGPEVIVVDDGSGYDLNDICARFDPSFALSLIKQKNNGPASARNLGAARARGSHLVFLDDDCLLPTNWAQRLAAAASQHPQAVIGGRTVNVLRENLFAEASQIIISHIYERQLAERRQELFFASNNLIVPRRLFDEVGGFDPAFRRAGGEDRDFCDRCVRAGHALAYHPEIEVHHLHKMNFPAFFRQHFHYGQSALDFHRLRAGRAHTRLRLERPSWYGSLVLSAYRRGRGPRERALTVLLLLSQAAGTLGFVSRMMSLSRGRVFSE